MRLTPALAYEKLRQDVDSMNKIILNKDGRWYHVYEWSAWLLKTVVCTEEMQQARGDAKPMAVSHCNTKTGDYVMAGFPLESVAKYIPEYIDMKEMEDGDLCIGITLPDELAALTPEEMTAAYEEWKQAQPLKENRKSVRQITSGDTKFAALARSGVFGIVAEVLSYPVEQKTPAENIEFISQMKQRIVSLL